MFLKYIKINILYILIQYFIFILFPYKLKYKEFYELSLVERLTNGLWYILFLKFSYLILFYTVVIFFIPLYLYFFQYMFFKRIYNENARKATIYLIFSLIILDTIRWLIMDTIRHY